MRFLLSIFLYLFPLYLCAQSWTITYYGDRYKTRRRTANGEWFHKDSLTCASMVHPFGTKLKVINPKTNQSVIVRVTDRGQFAHNNIDLTYGAFGQICEHKLGRIKVFVEEINNIKTEENNDTVCKWSLQGLSSQVCYVVCIPDVEPFRQNIKGLF